jgi:hypothetical protein
MERFWLILLGLVLAGLSVIAGARWIHDGDGTCGAIYHANLDRTGCARKLAPTALASAGLAAGTVLAWDTASRRSVRPGRRTVAGVVGTLATVVVVVAVGAALDRPRNAGAGGVAPVPVATSAPR